MATGPDSGIVVIDIDEERAFEILAEQYGLLPDTVEQHTGRGRQLFFRYPDGATIRNKTGLGGCPGVDVRGAGGYAVIPPSQHINGRRYAWELSSDPTEGAQPAQLPSAWLGVLTEPALPTAPTNVEGDTSVLREGQRNDGLFRFACSMRAKGMSQQAIEAALLAENEARCGPPLSGKEVCRIATSVARYKPGTMTAESKRATPSNSWHPFPIHVLPDPLRSFVRDGARALACDPAYIALPVLAVVASAIGNTRRIRLKRGWPEPPIVWAAIIGESGTLKTPAYACAIEPVLDIQRAALKEYEAARAEYEIHIECYEKERAAWRKAKDDFEEPPQKPEPPTPVRFIVSDVTVEALVPILEANPRGVLLARDELAAWFGSFDKYSGGTGKLRGDAAQWESMHNAGLIVVDRKTGDKRTMFIRHAAVSICGGIQPRTLSRALGEEHFESGLAQRFLFVMPPRKPKRWSDAEIPETVEAAYVDIVKRLYELCMNPPKEEDGDPEPVHVPLASDALRAWIVFVNEHGERQLETSGDLAAAFSKLEAYAARFALVFHLVRSAAADPTLVDENAVDAASVAAGIELSRWFCQEIERVYAALRETDEDRDIRELVEWIERRGGSVSPRELQAGKREFRSSVEQARGALQLLVDLGVGTWERPGPTRDGGRPTERFQLVTGVSANETLIGDPTPGGFVGADSAVTRARGAGAGHRNGENDAESAGG